jgi:mutator protein MutT
VLARFCPACGHATERVPLDGRTRARCPACRHVDWGNPKPAVGAILTRGGRVLLSRRARDPHRGMWDLPGGFLESGEHPEDAIRRELREETGLDARVLGLAAVATGEYQGEATLNLVYRCEAEGEPRADDDSAELRWFAPDEVPRPLAFPHEEAALDAWRRGG